MIEDWLTEGDKERIGFQTQSDLSGSYDPDYLIDLSRIPEQVSHFPFNNP